jgi:predicted transcriptional regulator
MLWLETLSATGHSDVRAFLEWRLRHALSLSKAADALGVSRRMVAYYSNGEKSAQADPAGLSGLGGQRRLHQAA